MKDHDYSLKGFSTTELLHTSVRGFDVIAIVIFDL